MFDVLITLLLLVFDKLRKYYFRCVESTCLLYPIACRVLYSVDTFRAYLEVNENEGVLWHGELLVKSDFDEWEKADAGTQPRQEKQHDHDAHPGESQ